METIGICLFGSWTLRVLLRYPTGSGQQLLGVNQRLRFLTLGLHYFQPEVWSFGIPGPTAHKVWVIIGNLMPGSESSPPIYHAYSTHKALIVGLLFQKITPLLQTLNPFPKL